MKKCRRFYTSKLFPWCDWHFRSWKYPQKAWHALVCQIDAPNTFNPQKIRKNSALFAIWNISRSRYVNKCTLYGMKPKCFWFSLASRSHVQQETHAPKLLKKTTILSISSGFKASKRKTVHHFKAQRFQPVHKERFNSPKNHVTELWGCTATTKPGRMSRFSTEAPGFGGGEKPCFHK